MGYKLLRLRIDSQKVDIWLLELGLQWNVFAFKARLNQDQTQKDFEKVDKKLDFCQKLPAGRQSAAPGGWVSSDSENEESLTLGTLDLSKSLNGLAQWHINLSFLKSSVMSIVQSRFYHKKCLSDKSLVIPMKELRLDDKLNFVEEPVEIMDREVKQLKQSRIPIIKVRWNSKRGPEFTWEREDQIRAKSSLGMFGGGWKWQDLSRLALVGSS
ncbi:hypothetical protein Tco_0126940 [Tanacetum coccineum]